MFRAVRHWWDSGRGKVTVRLFLFEFVVVVAGVLTAQGLANWVSARADARNIAEEDQRVRYETGRARQTSRVWLAALPCLNSRVDEIARLAASGAPVDPALLKTPRFLGYSVEPVPPDMFREFHARLGNERVDDYFLIIGSSAQVMNSYREARHLWDRFALLDPALGAPSSQDRATVRDVAMQVRSQLDVLRLSSEMIDATAGRIGIAPLTSGADYGRVEPVRNCAEVWQNGRIWRDS